MADTTLRKASVGRREDMHEITITENPGQVTEQYTVRPVSVNLDADRRNETFPDAAVASGAAVLATSSIITAEESIPAAAADASDSALMSHVRIHSAYLNNDSDTTPVPQDNTAEPADAFLSGMQDPVTSQPQADVYQDMKEVHYLTETAAADRSICTTGIQGGNFCGGNFCTGGSFAYGYTACLCITEACSCTGIGAVGFGQIRRCAV